MPPTIRDTTGIAPGKTRNCYGYLQTLRAINRKACRLYWWQATGRAIRINRSAQPVEFASARLCEQIARSSQAQRPVRPADLDEFGLSGARARLSGGGYQRRRWDWQSLSDAPADAPA